MLIQLEIQKIHIQFLYSQVKGARMICFPKEMELTMTCAVLINLLPLTWTLTLRWTLMLRWILTCVSPHPLLPSSILILYILLMWFAIS